MAVKACLDTGESDAVELLNFVVDCLVINLLWLITPQEHATRREVWLFSWWTFGLEPAAGCQCPTKNASPQRLHRPPFYYPIHGSAGFDARAHPDGPSSNTLGHWQLQPSLRVRRSAAESQDRSPSTGIIRSEFVNDSGAEDCQRAEDRERAGRCGQRTAQFKPNQTDLAPGSEVTQT